MKFKVMVLFAFFALLLASCGTPPAPAVKPEDPEKEVPATKAEEPTETFTPTSAPCPPIGANATKVSVSDDPSYPNDGSSIEVFTDTHAYTDPGGSPWCDTTELEIEPADLTGLPPCPVNWCLAAVDVKPDNIKFPYSENTSATKPELSYDLDEHKPEKDPNDCGSSSYCYSIYQSKPGTLPWRYVGPAQPTKVENEWFAEGRIFHFSIFALVELPDPVPVPEPRTLGMIVASEFIEDDRGDISVSFLISSDDLGELDPASGQRLFRFSNVDPSSFEGEIPPDCPNLPSVAEQFTCLFPIETEVELVHDPQGQIVLRALELGYEVRFSVSNVEVY